MHDTATTAVPINPHITMHTRVFRNETVRVPVGGEQTLGAFIDDYMSSVARDDGQVEHFELDIAPDVFLHLYGGKPA